MGGSQTKSPLHLSFHRLCAEIVGLDQSQFWESLFRSELTVEQVFSEISPGDVRRLKATFPTNFVTLLAKVSDAIIICADGVISSRGDMTYLKSCLLLLIRFMPFLHEIPEENISEKIFWNTSNKMLNILDETSDLNISASMLPECIPLGAKLLKSLARLLFLPNFTISWENSVIKNIIWFNSVNTDMANDEGIYFSNRQLVLRALVVCMSDKIYEKIDSSTICSPWIFYFSSQIIEFTGPIIGSLINVILHYDPVGWGIPYSSYVTVDQHEPLLHASLQLLNILLDYNVPERRLLPECVQQFYYFEDGEVAFNLFHAMLQNMDDITQFSRIYHSIVRSLESPITAASTYLPNSTKGVTCYQELVFFFWKFVELNEDFLTFLLARENICKIVYPIIYLINEYRTRSDMYGFLSVTFYTIMHLSGYRLFSVQLNESFEVSKHPALPVFYGSYADSVILTIYKVFTESPKVFKPLHPCLLTVLSNISPYLKKVSLTATSKIFALMKIFANTKFLYANESNYTYISFFLEMVDNILVYQSSGNPYVVQYVLLHGNMFVQLAQVPSELLPRAESHSVEPTIHKRMLPSQLNLSGFSSNISQSASPRQKSIQLRRTQILKPSQLSALNSSPTLDESKPTNSFFPTHEWMCSWKRTLRLTAILRIIEKLGPRIQEVINENPEEDAEATVLKFIQDTTLVGLLPVPHAISTRRFERNLVAQLWFTTYMWHLVYNNSTQPPVFQGTDSYLSDTNVLF